MLEDVNFLIAGSCGGGESPREKPDVGGGVGHDGKMSIYQLILKHFNILTTVMVIQVHWATFQPRSGSFSH